MLDIFRRVSGAALLFLLRSALKSVRIIQKTCTTNASKISVESISQSAYVGPNSIGKIAILIPAFNNWELTSNCLKSILKTEDSKIADVWVVDDASTDETRASLESYFPEIKVIHNDINLGFLLSCNNAFEALGPHYDWIHLLNNDTSVNQGFLLEALEVAREHTEAALVGSKLLYPGGTLQEAGGIFWRNGNAWNVGRNGNAETLAFNIDRQVDYCSGASLLLRTEALRSVGYFSEEFLPAYCEDADLAFKLRKAGFETWYAHKSEVIHLEGMSHGIDSTEGIKAHQVKNLRTFEVKWRQELKSHIEEDPFRLLDAAFRLSPGLKPSNQESMPVGEFDWIPTTLLPLANRLANFYIQNSARSYRDLLFRQNRLRQRLPRPIGKFSKIQSKPNSGFILIVDHAIPKPDTNAGDSLTFSYLKLLRCMGKDVVFFPVALPVRDSYYEDLIELGVKVIDANETFEEWIGSNGSQLDRAWIARPEIAIKTIKSIRRNSSAPIAYLTHDVHHLRLRAQAKIKRNPLIYLNSLTMEVKEKRIFRDVDLILSISTEESAYIASRNIQTQISTLVPYFLWSDAPTPRLQNSFKNASALVFLGGYRHEPNRDAAEILAKKIMPLVWQKKPDTILTLAGSFPDQTILSLANDRIRVPGKVDDIKKLFDENSVFVAPLRFGAGVKGKTIEAMKFGIPVVGSRVAFQGIQVKDNEEALVGEDEQEIASLILTLLESPPMCEEISKKSIDFVKREYSLDSARESLRTFLDLEVPLLRKTEKFDPKSMKSQDA